MSMLIYKGNDSQYDIEVLDTDGKAIDLTAGELDLQVTDWNGNAIFSKSSTVVTEIVITNAPAGLATVFFLPADTATLNADMYVFYIDFTSSAGKISTISEGELQVVEKGILTYIRNRVRNFLGDKEDLNVLHRAEETSDEELNEYISKAVEYFNSTGFTTYYTIVDFPNRGNLIDGTVIQILIGKGILSARNLLSYRDTGGVSVQDYDTYGRYVNWFNVLINKYQQQVTDIKRDINVNKAYGISPSPLSSQCWWY